jgi:hypothetical protein
MDPVPEDRWIALLIALLIAQLIALLIAQLIALLTWSSSAPVAPA